MGSNTSTSMRTIGRGRSAKDSLFSIERLSSWQIETQIGTGRTVMWKSPAIRALLISWIAPANRCRGSVTTDSKPRTASGHAKTMWTLTRSNHE